MKLFRILILLTIAISLGGWLLRSHPSHVIEEGTNTFSSPVYSDYYQQLNTFLEQHPNTIQLGPDKRRETHESFVRALREMIAKGTNPAFVNDLVKWIYLKANLTKATENYFYSIIPPGENDLVHEVKELRKSGRFSGLEHNSPHEDHYLHGNLPFLLFETQSTQVFRMGNPLGDSPKIAWPWIKVVVYPEFIRFLEVQPSHLYVNLMKRKGVEGAATQTLEKLESEYPSLSVVTLDKNSTFYWQNESDYPETMDSGKFKELFNQKLTAKKGAYFWSVNLDRTQWPSELKSLSDKVHKTYFDNRSTLNRKERQDYIELTYLAILDRLVDVLKPSSLNITCRQGMDRAPSLYVLWMVQKKLIDDHTARALLLAPPLLISNRPSHVSRIQRFVSAARVLDQ